MRRKQILISLHGIDGSGKSTQASLLAKSLNERGHNAVVIWARWDPSIAWLARFAGALLFGTGRTLKERGNYETAVDSVRTRRHLVSIYNWLSWKEYLIQTHWRLWRYGRENDIIVFDRYVSDLIIDRARRLEWDDMAMRDAAVNAYAGGFPRPSNVVFLDIDLQKALVRKPEEDQRALKERHSLYLRATEVLADSVIDANGSIEEVHKRLVAVVLDCIAGRADVRTT